MNGVDATIIVWKIFSGPAVMVVAKVVTDGFWLETHRVGKMKAKGCVADVLAFQVNVAALHHSVDAVRM